MIGTKFTSSFIILVSFLYGNCQDIVYPYYHLSENHISGAVQQSRGPLYAPNRCPPNQLLYPGDQKDDWVCDCKPGFVYSPQHSNCFAILREGPCERGFHLILRTNKVIPECVKNPCLDGYARYSDRKCYKLGQPGEPCSDELIGGGVFNINETTLVPECIKRLNPDVFNYIDKYPKVEIRPSTETVHKSTEASSEPTTKRTSSRRKAWVVLKTNRKN